MRLVLDRMFSWQKSPRFRIPASHFDEIFAGSLNEDDDSLPPTMGSSRKQRRTGEDRRPRWFEHRAEPRMLQVFVDDPAAG